MAEPIQGDTFWPGVDQETADKIIRTQIPSYLSSMVTNAGPDPRLPGPLGYIPLTGMAEGVVGTLGSVIDLGRALASKVTGYGLGGSLKNAADAVHDFTTAASEHFNQTQDEVYNQIPHYQPTAEEAPTFEKGKEFSQMVGNALPVAPGSILSGLPKALRLPLSFMTPTTARPATDMIINTTAGPLMGYALSPPDDQEQQQPAPQDQQTQPPPPNLAAQLGPINSPFLQAPQTTTVASSSPSLAQGLGNIDTSGVGMGDTTTAQSEPWFHEEGSGPMSWGQFAAGLGGLFLAGAGARFLHSRGLAITTALRDERFNDPQYAQQKADYDNEQIAINAGQQISNAQGGRTDAPSVSGGAVHDALVSAQNATLDSTAKARDYIKLSSDDPQVADKLEKTYGLVLDPGRWQGKLGEFLRTGRDRISGVTMPAPKQVFDDIAALPQDRQKVMIDGLNAANEMDNRNYNYGRGNVTNAAHDFASTPDTRLVQYTQDMLADPQLADIANRFWGMGRGIVDIGEARGYFTAQEAARMRAVRPNYVPEVGLDGTVTHALGPRELAGAAGINQVNTTPWSAMAQHIEGITRQFELNDIARMLSDHQLDVQQNVPGAAQFLNPVKNPYPRQQAQYATVAPSADATREPIYSVRRPTGITFYKSDNPDFFNFIKGQNPNKTLTNMGIFATARRVVQMTTTGLLSLASGRAFPITHLGRVGYSMNINRPWGTVGGPIDAAVQRLSGGKFGYRATLDPTNYGGMAYDILRTQFDNAVRDLGEMFNPKNPNTITQLMHSALGPHTMQSISDSMQRYYMGTTTHEMAAEGLAGTGMPVRFQPPALSLGREEGVRAVRSMSAQLSPKLFMSGGKLGTILPHVIDLRSALDETYGNIMDAGNRWFYRMNKAMKPDLDPNVLTYEARNLVGNPSTRGASKVVRGYTQLEEYSNIAAQAIARRGRALNETPVSTSASMISHLGSLALLSIYTAMRNPQTMQYLQNIISTQGRAANVYMFGNDDPQYNTAISLPQEVRPFYPLILDATSKVMGLAAMQHDPMTFDSVLQFMKDFFSEHIENSTWESSLHGAADAMSFMDIPSWVNAASAIGGKSIRIDLERIVNDWRNQGIGLSTFSIPTGQDRPLPNHPQGDHLFEGQDAKVLSTMISSVFGSLAGVFDNAMNLKHYAHDMDSFWDAAGQVGKDWIQKAMDLNPSMNSVLWENPVRESMRTPIVEMVERRLNNMQTAGGPLNAELMEGTTGGKFPLNVTPLPAEDRNAPPPGPMHNLYYAVKAEHAFLQSNFIAEINAVKKQMQDAAQQPMDNAERRQWMNNQTRLISDKYRYINTLIEDQNAKLSNVYGRRIDIGAPIDWKKGLDQFPPLN